MNDIVFDLRSLFPKFSAIKYFESPEGLTSLFVAFMLLVFIILLIYAGYRFIQSLSKIKYYFNLIIGMKQEDLALKREEILQRAMKNTVFGKLWREFDESLVYSRDGKILSNTLDADHFFNEKTLARSLTDNRLLAAAPAFLTAIGVLGTFVGLELGLNGLDMTAESDVAALKTGIFSMMSGASTAFTTSVWGVFLSLFFNFIEKSMERVVRRKIISLQDTIDYLYPRITAEQTLIKISDAGNTTAETMQTLAEQIGDRLQQALTQATESINESMKKNLLHTLKGMEKMSSTIRSGLEEGLKDVLNPAIESITDIAQKSSGEMAQGLVDKFLQGVDKAAESQQHALESAASKVDSAVDGMAEQMQNIMLSLQEHGRAAHESSRQAIASITDVVQKSQADFNERSQAMNMAMEQQIKDLTSTMQGQLSEFGHIVKNISDMQNQRDAERHELFSRTVNEMGSTQRDVAEKLSSLSGDFSLVAERIRELVNAHESLSKQILTASKNLETASISLGTLGQNLNAASDKIESGAMVMEQGAQEMSGTINESVSLAGEFSKELRKSLEAVESLEAQFSKTAQLMGSAVIESNEGFVRIKAQLDTFTKELLKISSNHADNLREHMNGLTQSTMSLFKNVGDHLKNHQHDISEDVHKKYTKFSNDVSELLSSFGEKTKSQIDERLNQWNHQTSVYTDNMTKAVQALAGVVDEIEVKVNKQ
ncbi:MAG: hypothetical protein EOM12_04665 [Verrucomicrobiae bacterium]|nr:hypothetical protein [Verrucomicrobiae bacterium]